MEIKKPLKIVRNYAFITIGLFAYALGWTAFLLPSEIVAGGMGGLGALIYFSTGFPVGYTIFLVNTVLIALAMRIMGFRFGLNTVYGIAVSALAFIILQPLITEPVVEDQLMAAIVGGIMGGGGVGIAFTYGGNSGGTDIIALLINKYRNISPGRIIMYFDLVIIASSYFIFHSIEKIVYGYVVMAVGAFTLDFIVEGARQSYQIMIISKKHETIAQRIGKEIGRGLTLLNGNGWYSGKETKIIFVIARKQENQRIMRIIKQTDENAFISVAKVKGVFGSNFEKIKI